MESTTTPSSVVYTANTTEHHNCYQLHGGKYIGSEEGAPPPPIINITITHKQTKAINHNIMFVQPPPPPPPKPKRTKKDKTKHVIVYYILFQVV